MQTFSQVKGLGASEGPTEIGPSKAQGAMGVGLGADAVSLLLGSLHGEDPGCGPEATVK